MFFQLSSGRVIEITVEQYFELTDEEIQYLIAYNYGEHQENPFFGSMLHNPSSYHNEDIEIEIDMLDVPEIDKLTDLDVDYDLEDIE